MGVLGWTTVSEIAMSIDCAESDCPRTYADGYCDVCGKAEAGMTTEASQMNASVVTVEAVVPEIQDDIVLLTYAFPAAKARARSLAGKVVTTRARVDVFPWPRPRFDFTAPETRIVVNPILPEHKARCATCAKPVKPEKKFCASCGAENSFVTPMLAGDVIGEQYEIEGVIAHGGMGWIYLGRDTRLDRRVIVKEILNAKDAGAVASADLESRFLSVIRHPAIVSNYNLVEHRGRSCIVMEYVHGASLRTVRAARGPLQPHEALGCLMGILPAVGHLHEMGLAYCDMKPDNVILTEDALKLIDLGAVRKLGDVSEDIYGTEGFLPPSDDGEQIPSVAMDIYGLGRTLLSLLLDFDNLGEHKHSMPPANAVNRVLTRAELGAAVSNDEEVPAFAMNGGGDLPPWLRVERVQRKGEYIHVMHGFAPAGFSRMEVSCTGSGGTHIVTLTCPLAYASLRRLVARATATESEERFESCAEMAAQCAGVMREMLGAAGLPAPEFDPFATTSDDLAALLIPGREWTQLPPTSLRKDAEGFDVVLRAIGMPDDRARLDALDAAVRSASSQGTGIEAHLRYVDTALRLGGDPARIRNVLQSAAERSPWDWRSAWEEGKFHLRDGRVREARACFDVVMRAMPGEPMPKFAKAMAGMALPQEGVRACEVILNARPSMVQASILRLRLLAEMDDRTGAEFDTTERILTATYPTLRPVVDDMLRLLLSKSDLGTHNLRGVWLLKRVLARLEAQPNPSYAVLGEIIALRTDALNLYIDLPGATGNVERMGVWRALHRRAAAVAPSWRVRLRHELLARGYGMPPLADGVNSSSVKARTVTTIASGVRS